VVGGRAGSGVADRCGMVLKAGAVVVAGGHVRCGERLRLCLRLQPSVEDRVQERLVQIEAGRLEPFQ
jgi:hypothetical protein